MSCTRRMNLAAHIVYLTRAKVTRIAQRTERSQHKPDASCSGSNDALDCTQALNCEGYDAATRDRVALEKLKRRAHFTHTHACSKHPFRMIQTHGQTRKPCVFTHVRAFLEMCMRKYNISVGYQLWGIKMVSMGIKGYQLPVS